MNNPHYFIGRGHPCREIESQSGVHGDCPNFCANKNGTVPFEPAFDSVKSS
jgi:hypothetical protein